MSLSIEECQALVSADMDCVDTLIHKRLQSNVALINQVSGYIVSSGGKRLRPQLVLLAAGASGYAGDQHFLVSAIIEFIHTATLLHDDVVDASNLRRGRDTANSVWGNEAAVLVGDFLYSRSFEMMVEINRLDVMSILATTTNRIAEGEVMQLLNIHEPGISEDQYIEVIEAKTARLFQAATQLGALLANQSIEIQQAMAAYGKHLGCAFQIADDVLDYQSNSESMGKNVGDDLLEGKTTLPLIYAMRDGSPSDRQIVVNAIEGGGLEALPAVMQVIAATNALEKSLQRARQASKQAIQALTPLQESRYKKALESVAHYAVERVS